MGHVQRYFDIECVKCNKKIGEVDASLELSSDGSFVTSSLECPHCKGWLELVFSLREVNVEEVGCGDSR